MRSVHSWSTIILFAGAKLTLTYSTVSPIYNCTVVNSNLSCSLIANGLCDNSMNLGVVCRTKQEIADLVRFQESLIHMSSLIDFQCGIDTMTTQLPTAVNQVSYFMYHVNNNS